MVVLVGGKIRWCLNVRHLIRQILGNKFSPFRLGWGQGKVGLSSGQRGLSGDKVRALSERGVWGRDIIPLVNCSTRLSASSTCSKLPPYVPAVIVPGPNHVQSSQVRTGQIRSGQVRAGYVRLGQLTSIFESGTEVHVVGPNHVIMSFRLNRSNRLSCDKLY